MSELHALAIDRREGVVVATVEGEIDASNANRVRDALIGTDAETLILDLHSIRYLDSAGVAMLDAVRRAMDLRLVLTEESTIGRALAITGMMQLIATYPNVDDAISTRKS
jgi:anti-anti-sigma factor